MGKSKNHKDLLGEPRDKIYLRLATLGRVGYTPCAPGTAGSLVALLLYAVVRGQFLFFIVSAASIYLAWQVCSRAEELLGEKDSQKIVIDDFAGMLLTFLFIPFSWRFAVVGFFLFRMLDMLKIPPADRIEKFPGSRGVVGDDLVAGLYANIILQLGRLVA